MYVFTRELGLIMASAQGIRLEKSKLRYHSQEFSLGEFSFVRGKEFWRLTGAKSIDANHNPVGESASSQIIRMARIESQVGSGVKGIIPRIALILRRLLHGEEAHPELFDHIQDSLAFIESREGGEELSEGQMRTLESLIVFRIVHLLGYVGNDKEINQSTVSDPLSVSLLDTVAGQRVTLNKHINKALRESQL